MFPTFVGTAHVAEAMSAADGFYGYEPQTYHQAMNCNDRDEWVKAQNKEMEGLTRLGVFEVVDKAEMGSQSTFINNKWVYKIKPDKFKARLVIRGFKEKDPGDTFAPTLKRSSSFQIL